VPGFCNHTRRAKRRILAVMNAKNKSHVIHFRSF
jgi:hypothetical protein